MEIKKGDIYYITGDVTAHNGFRLAGHPGVIVSNDTQNACASNVMICTLTSKIDKTLYPTDCEIICKQPSKIVCNQIYSISKDNLGDFIKSCTEDEVRRLNKCLLLALEIHADEYVQEIEAYEMEEMREALSAAEDSANRWREDCNIIAAERDCYRDIYNNLLEKVLK